MFKTLKRSATATIAVAVAISSVSASVASAQDYPPPPPPPGQYGPPQGYQGQYPQGYQDAPPPYQAPPGYNGTQPPPPPPGFQEDQEYGQQQAQDQRYEAYAEDWAQRNCVKSRGNVGAGAVIGGLFGALLGSGIAGRGNHGAGAFVGGVAGAGVGAAVASSSGGATSPGCPPGYVVARGAPAFYYEGSGPYYYDAPGWYVPWIFVGGRWTFRPYPYHSFYWHHYGYGRPGFRGGHRPHR